MPPSARRLARLLESDLADATEWDRELRERLLAEKPELAAAVSAAKRIGALLRKENSEDLGTVLAAAKTVLANLAGSLGKDAAAVQAALDHPWTTSPGEGQINRIKAIKRRADFPSLQQRVLNAA